MSRPSVFLPVSDAYDRWASTYDAMDNPLTFAAERALRSSLVDVHGQDTIELGCGTGRNLAALRDLGARSVIGCDLSQGMLAKARERDPGFRLVSCDMTRGVPLPERSADLVLFCLSLEHVGDLVRPLAEARRLVRRFGTVSVFEIHPFLTLSGVGAHFEDTEGEVRMPTFPHRFADYLNAFSDARLKVEACREWRPADLGDGLPAKVLKRGLDSPLLVSFSATPV